MTEQDHVQSTVDIVVGVGAGTSTLVWLDYLNVAAQEITLIGGACLVLYRVCRIMYKWWKRRSHN